MKKLLQENRKARFNYEFLQAIQCGIVLFGSELKSILNYDFSITEGYCYITDKKEIFIKGFNIQEYKSATYTNHEPLREKKLLLNKNEIEELHYKIKTNKGFTIIPTKLYIADNGLIKMEIALCKGKKTHDKRESLKQKDIERELKRKF